MREREIERERGGMSSISKIGVLRAEHHSQGKGAWCCNLVIPTAASGSTAIKAVGA